VKDFEEPVRLKDLDSADLDLREALADTRWGELRARDLTELTARLAGLWEETSPRAVPTTGAMRHIARTFRRPMRTGTSRALAWAFVAGAAAAAGTIAVATVARTVVPSAPPTGPTLATPSGGARWGGVDPLPAFPDDLATATPPPKASRQLAPSTEPKVVTDIQIAEAGAQHPALLPAPASDVTSASGMVRGGAQGSATEIQLLEQSQALRRDDPERALLLVEEHAKLFRGGALSEEREMLRIELLQRLGRGAEATLQATDFAHRYPHSVYLPRVRQLLHAE